MVLDACGMTAREFAEVAGVSVRSLRTAAQGAAGPRVARRLEAVTGIPAERFR